MTFEELSASNLCKSKKEETPLFEDMLYQEFKALEKDYDKLDNVLDKFNKQQEKVVSLNVQWKEIRRYGKIIMKLDTEHETGFYSKFLVLYNGQGYECEMKNGEVVKLFNVGVI